MEDNYSKWRTREGIKNLPEYDGGRQASDESGQRPRRGVPAKASRDPDPLDRRRVRGRAAQVSQSRRVGVGDVADARCARSKPMNGSGASVRRSE